MRRKIAREKAMNLLYQMDIQNDFSHKIIECFCKDLPSSDQQVQYIKDIVNCFIQNRTVVDQIIEKNSNEWKLSRIAKVDLAILRVAITEILYFNDIPINVSINEAVEMAKIYSTDESGKFINGLLGNVVEEK